MNNLANSYFAAGRHDEALKLREEVLPLRRKVLGPEHPETLNIMNNLANSYFAAGRHEEALKLKEEVVSIRRKAFGTKHPDTLKAMNDLADCHSIAGHPDQALKLYEEVLPLSRKTFGAEHPDTLTAMHNLAKSFADTGRRDEAFTLQEELLPLSRKVKGPDHPDTLTAMHNLAISYYEVGRREEALKMQEEVLPIRSKVLGVEHPDTLMAMNNLAASYAAAGHLDEALKLLEAVLPLRRKVLGLEHPDTLMALDNLVLLHCKDGRIETSAGILSEQAEFLRRAGFDQDSELQAKLHQKLVGLAEQQCTGPVEEDAIGRQYAETKESFRQTSVHLFTITLQLETTDEARAKQRKEVEALRNAIANGKPFAEVARERSEDPYASDGGDNLTVKRRDRAEPLDSAIFALKPGVPEIHEDGQFLRIIKVEDRAEGDIAPLEDVREEIAGILLQRQRDALLRQWREEAQVKVDAWEKANKHAAGGP
jgi:tetratricopeptide (TPR) repeat protein